MNKILQTPLGCFLENLCVFFVVYYSMELNIFAKNYKVIALLLANQNHVIYILILFLITHKYICNNNFKSFSSDCYWNV